MRAPDQTADRPAPAAADPLVAAGYSTPYRVYCLLLLLATYTLNFIDRYVISVLLPQIKGEFALADWQLGLMTGTAFAFFYSAMGLPIARWADGGIRRDIIALAIAVWSVMAAAGGMAANYFQLLLARIGVAVGEAGCTPPSHSLIGDLFSARRRATAIAVFSLGPPFGVSLALALGGWLGEDYGWRAALVMIGLPGLALAALVRFTVREPPRGLVEQRTAKQAAPSILETARFLISLPTYRHMVAAIGLVSIASYGTQMWMPSFLQRSYDMNLGDVGRYLSIGVFASQTIGGLGGAWLAETLGRHDRRWWLWGPAVFMAASVPLAIAAYLTHSLWLTVSGLFVLHVALLIYNAPTYSLGQMLVGLRMRAMVSAVTLLVVSVIGLGIGPFLVGTLSDLFAPRFGAESLRYALLVPPLFVAWSAFHYYMAGRTAPADIARAPD